MNESEVKNKLEMYLEKEGIKASHVAAQIGVCCTIFSRWRHGKRNLTRDQLDNLIQYLGRV